MPSSDDTASTTKSRARSFTPWWWTLLTVARVDARIQGREPRADDEVDRVEVLVVEPGVAVAERVRPLRADVLVQRPAECDVEHLQAAAHAEHRLARRRRTRAAARSRIRRARGRRSTRGAAASRRSCPATCRSRLRARARRAARHSPRASRRRACVGPSGEGITTASAPADCTQCTIDCSTYCSVLPVKIGRCGSAWKKHAEMPMRGRSLIRDGNQSACSKKRVKSARVHGRGLVWWQMSFSAMSAIAAICSFFTPTADSDGAMPISRFRLAEPADEAGAVRSRRPRARVRRTCLPRLRG